MSSYPGPESRWETARKKLVGTENIGAVTGSATGSIPEQLKFLQDRLDTIEGEMYFQPTTIEQLPNTVAPYTIAALSFGTPTTTGAFGNNASETPQAIAIHPKGLFIAVALTATPFLIVYPYDYVTGTVGAALANGPDHPAVAVTAVAFSPDGNWLAIGTGTSPRIRVYAFSDAGGGSVGALASSDTLHAAATAVGIAFNPAGDALLSVSVVKTVSPRISPFNTSTGALSAAVAPGVNPVENLTLCASWSQAGDYFCIGQIAAPWMEVRSWNGSAIGNKLANPATTPTGAVQDAAWSPEDNLLAVAHTTSPRISMYPWTPGTIGVKIADPALLPNADGKSVKFTRGGTGIIIGHETNPGLTGYPVSTVPAFGARFQPSNLTDPPSFACIFDFHMKHVLVIGETNTVIDVVPFNGSQIVLPTITPQAHRLEIGVTAVSGFMKEQNDGHYKKVYLPTGVYDLPIAISDMIFEGATATVRDIVFGTG